MHLAVQCKSLTDSSVSRSSIVARNAKVVTGPIPDMVSAGSKLWEACVVMTGNTA